MTNSLLIRLLCCALAVFTLLGSVGCGGSAHNFERIAMPIRFADVRDSAAWSPHFRTEWWKPIDAAYERYDDAIERIVREQWESFALEATLARQQLNPGDAEVARQHWAKNQRITRALSEAEATFVSELETTLPREARTFVELLRARSTFWRATGFWADSTQRMAGPLEVLALSGRRAVDAQTIEAAIVAYSNLAALADRTRLRCAQDAIAFMEDAPALTLAIQVAKGEARTIAEAAWEARQKQHWRDERGRADEALRLGLLREGRAFSAAITDEKLREWFNERLDATLHDGMRSSASIRAFARLAARAIVRRKPDEPALVVELNLAVDQVLERQRVLRTALASGSSAERQRTFEAIVALPAGIVEVLKRAVGDDVLWKLAIGTIDIEAGERSEDEVLEAALAETVVVSDETPPTPRVSEEMEKVRDRGMRTIVGFPLSPIVVRELSARLALNEEDTRALDELRSSETKRAIEASTDAIASIKTGFETLGSKQKTAEPDVAVRQFMASLRSIAARIRATDRAANEVVLSRAAEFARVEADDPRIEVARVEFELLGAVGTDTANDEVEAIGGITPEALANPFEVLRRMRIEPTARASAEDIILIARAELIAAADEAHTDILNNVGRFLIVLLDAQRGQAELAAGKLPKSKKLWRPALAGSHAAELRFRLADEFNAVLGEAFAQAYLIEFRQLTEPGLSPPQPRAFWELDAYAAGRGLAPAARAASAPLRDSLAIVLDAADDRRASAQLALHTWRGQWVRLESLNSPEEWARIGFASPLAAYLRSQSNDADERALAECAVFLDFPAAPTEAVRALARAPVALPRAMKPYFP